MKNSIDDTSEIKMLISQLTAFANTIQEILNNAHTMESNRYSSFRDMAQIYIDFVDRAKTVLKVSTMVYTFDISKMGSYGDTLWPEQKRIMEQTLLSARILLSSLEASVDFVDDEYDNLSDFLFTRLRSVVYTLPEKEIEIQNAIDSLLQGRGLSKGAEYDRESGKFEFSGREYIPDFIIPKLKLCIEVKLLKEGRRSKMVEEISADITAYKKQYERILFVVYDLGAIRDEVEFKRDIEMTDGVKVIVVKH